MKNKFLQISLGLCLILFAAGFFVRSFSAATAAPAPKKIITEDDNEPGKYQMMNTSSGDLGSAIMIWNTETGESVIYYFSSSKGAWKKKDYQLPANPFAN